MARKMGDAHLDEPEHKLVYIRRRGGLRKVTKEVFEIFLQQNAFSGGIFQSAQREAKSSSVIRQKGESQNGCYKKTKYAKFSEKRTFLIP